MHAGSAGAAQVVASFYSTLRHQLLVIFALIVVAILVWNGVRTVQYRRAAAAGDLERFSRGADVLPEPRARLIARICFGVLWLFDGLLQLQSSMPLGLPSGVLQPAASGSPGWVRALVGFGVTAWTSHPVQAAAATVWIQCGLGIALLVAPRGRWSRAAGAASAGWGLIVWSFGEAFGASLAPGASFLFGFPGAALFYTAAGVLVALPERVWSTQTLGRVAVRAMGGFLVLMALLQGWPGRGAWSGGSNGLTSSMVSSMAQTPQPHAIATLVTRFASFDTAHGALVNLVVVAALAAAGVLLMVGRGRALMAGFALAAVLCLVTWVVVQDFGFFGGVGTDPNSMLPFLALLATGVVAVRRPGAGAASVLRPAVSSPALLDRATPSYLLQLGAAVVAGAVVLIGAAPMALAAADRTADPQLAIDAGAGGSALHVVAPPIALVDQDGRAFSLASLRGHVVALTFLDPVCTTDCPFIAQELRAAQLDLGDPANLDVVAVDANPDFRSTATLRTFLSKEGLSGAKRWWYLTGSLTALHRVWRSYGVAAFPEPGGAMVDHTEVVYLIDRQGREVAAYPADPLPSSTLRSSYTGLLVRAIGALL